MAHILTLSAQEITQPGLKGAQKIFITSIPIRELIDITMFKVDFWQKDKMDTDEDQGYQRVMNDSHAQNISSYLQKPESLLPTSILVSTRKNVPDFEKGKLTISKYPLFIVDGQHRIAGLRIAIQDKALNTWKDASLPVILLSGFDKFEEMTQFVDLNTKQKKVETNLALELMYEMAKLNSEMRKRYVEEGNDWKIRAIKMVNEINKITDSPWKNNIKLAGEKRQPSHITTAVSFATSLRPLMRGAFNAERNLSNNTKVLMNYWQALRLVFMDAFLEPKDYGIQKTPGLFSLHELLEAILQKKAGLKFGYEVEPMVKLLRKIFEESSTRVDFWQSDLSTGVTMFGSMKGFRLLADKFITALNVVDR